MVEGICIIIFVVAFISWRVWDKERKIPKTHEDTTRAYWKGFEHTQGYKDAVEFSKELDKTLKK